MLPQCLASTQWEAVELFALAPEERECLMSSEVLQWPRALVIAVLREACSLPRELKIAAVGGLSETVADQVVQSASGEDEIDRAA